MLSDPAKRLCAFDGVTTAVFDPPVIDTRAGGTLPAGIFVKFSPDPSGFHALEFLVWALGDARRGGANVRHFLHSAPPWLNTPGHTMQLDVYVYPRSPDIDDQAALAEMERETLTLAEFLQQVHALHWAACAPTTD